MEYNKIVITTDGAVVKATYTHDGKEEVGTVESGRYETFGRAAQAALCHITERSPKKRETQPDKPVYKAGDKAVIIGNSNAHCYKNGDVVTLVEQYIPLEWATGRIGGYVRECDISPYTEPAQPDKTEPVKLYCVKDSGPYSNKLTKGKVYRYENQIFEFDDWMAVYTTFDDFKRANPHAMSCLIPLVKRPAKVGEWVYVTDGKLHHYEPNKIYRVFHVWDDACVCFAWDGNGNVWPDQYLVLDGYTPEPEYEWVDGYKGFESDLKCRGMQYTIGKIESLPDGETEVECFKGFHFCKTLDDVYKHYANNGTNRFCKVRGYVKKGYNYTDKYCARKLEVVEEIKKPEKKYWSGRAVCYCNLWGFTKGKTYTFVNGVTVDDEGDIRPNPTSSTERISATTDNWFAEMFIELKD